MGVPPPEGNIVEENEFLARVQKKARELAKPPAPVKRKQPKATRHQSRRMQVVSTWTNNQFKAGFVTAEDAAEQWKYVADADEEVLTREVGPGDVHNPTTGYSTGKATGYRSAGK